MSLRICTSEFLLSTVSGLGMAQTWMPRIVDQVFLESTKDGEIARSPDPVTMIDGDLTWYNNTNDDQVIIVQVLRAPRSIVAQSPSTVIIHDAWTWTVGASPSAAYPSVTQDAFGGRAQIDRPSVAAEDLKYGRQFYDTDAGQAWENVGLVPAGQSMHFRYLAAVQTPGIWTKPSEFDARYEAQARWARLLAFAVPYPGAPPIGTVQYPANVRVFRVAGTHSFRAPGWMSTGDLLDIIPLGGGGGGEGEILIAHGAGGWAGEFATGTYIFGTDFDADTVFTVDVGAGGDGGPYFSDGEDGGDSKVTWIGPDQLQRALVGIGGHGGAYSLLAAVAHQFPPEWGETPGSITYHDQTYEGGAADKALPVQQPANPPGGGGSGALEFQFGMAGAPGAVWFNARKAT